MFPSNKFKLILPFMIMTLLIACNTEQENPVDSPPTNEEASNIDSERPQDKEDSDLTEDEENLTLPTEELQKGTEGESVRQLQEVLIDIGYELDLTSNYDHQTTWAITDLQLQHDDLYITGIYDEQTKQWLEEIIINNIELDPGSSLAYSEDISLEDDKIELGNPYEVLALINKSHLLPADYTPEDLVIPDVRFPFEEDDPKKQMRKVASDSLEELFTAADQEGLDLFAQSGYRSYDTQEGLFAAYVSNYGEEEANTFSARAGESEHQSGLSMDVTSPDVGYRLVTEFGKTEEGEWLQEHVADFGFIIRYPEGKEEITGYQYEPWHLRYVGKKAAKEIMGQGITLEEYLEQL